MLSSLVIFLMTGCSQKLEPAQSISWEDLNKAEYNQKRVVLDGYLKVPTSVMATDTMTLPLHQDLQEESKKVTLSVKVGEGNNQAEMPPKNFKESDLKVRANDGAIIAANSRIRVSGKLVVSGKVTLLMGPLSIEKL
jgi:hypothetical protein